VDIPLDAPVALSGNVWLAVRISEGSAKPRSKFLASTSLYGREHPHVGFESGPSIPANPSIDQSTRGVAIYAALLGS
ncbi:MAG: hypothetical protein R3324_10690, partial [Halobacteriales archaeon]|nr:hypothetical protein [Halobacteriales archaeon]